jgi:hypothetical protein
MARLRALRPTVALPAAHRGTSSAREGSNRIERRPSALDLHVRGMLPDDYDSTAFHLNPEMRPAIERGSAAMAALLEAEADS